MYFLCCLYFWFIVSEIFFYLADIKIVTPSYTCLKFLFFIFWSFKPQTLCTWWPDLFIFHMFKNYLSHNRLLNSLFLCSLFFTTGLICQDFIILIVRVLWYVAFLLLCQVTPASSLFPKLSQLLFFYKI